jgi:oligopeptide transport system substrate-binding protein
MNQKIRGVCFLKTSSYLILIILYLLIIGISDIRKEDRWVLKYQPQNLSLLAEDQHFRYNIGSEPETLDPGIITGAIEMRLVIGLFEGLLSYDPSSLEPVPGIAYKYEIDSTGKVYTFYLREEAKWNNGIPMTALDFHRSWERVLNPKTGASYASQLYPIQGAEAYNKGKLDDFKQVGVKVKSKHVLEVTLHNPCPYFTDLCAFVTLFPTPVDLIEQHGDSWVRPENIISNGPFQVKSWISRSIVTLEPNPHYWDKKHVHLKKVSAYLYDDSDTFYKLFLQGELDWIADVPSSKSREVGWNPEYYAMPVLGSYFYRFNVTRPPLDDVRVRQALSMSIDRTVITRQILKGGQQPANFFCPPVAGYEHVDGLPYNTEKAKQLLAEAGYGQGGKAFPTLEILYNTQEDHKKIAEAISETWREVLGIEVKLRNTEWKIFLSEMDQLNYDICRSSWFGDYGDPNTFFDMFVKDGGNNRTGWFNPQYDKWLKQSQLEPDHSKRLKIFQKMEKMLVEDEAPLLPLYMYVNKGMLSEKVHGWYENVLDFHPIKHIWMEKE